MKDALTSFGPKEVKIIQDAYALALKTFEATESLSKIHRDALAREIIILAEKGCLETERLATRAIMRVMPLAHVMPLARLMSLAR
jgi:hypothetical protein